ncbi:hypothetical protein A2Z33_02250 [Candidatus Gottesmanbacteria bacterium RBG_16_52_11]|uniref:Glycosyltransferase n=1 Tax=Candidatus Gottesmanbacteria bacterium RBG_16_52_11 TaxID=1798374 RepID=A0A1F5YR36_9BACT|nr:MAG: hypothetical protein A2Z33_02250 [Candidatus Gottesmanbacteria bacterium RBG_16_52_11]
MGNNSVMILGIPVSTVSRQDILKHLKKYLKHPASEDRKRGQKSADVYRIVTPNPEQVMLAMRQPVFGKLLSKADLALPDGIGLVWAARFLGLPGPSGRLSGVDLMLDLVQSARKLAAPIGLIGGPPGLALDTLDCLRKMYPGLSGYCRDLPRFVLKYIRDGSASNSGHYEAQNEVTVRKFLKSFASQIVQKNIRVAFIGLGAPKQEWVMDVLAGQLNSIGLNHPVILTAVGGAFSMICGKSRRAPGIVRRIGLEWFWRLGLEPWRIRRQLDLPLFVIRVFQERFSGRRI